MNEFFVSGKIGRPHGLEGYLTIHVYSGEYEHLIAFQELTLIKGQQLSTLKIKNWAQKGSLLLVQFENFLVPEVAKRWTGWEIMLPRNKAAPLQHDEIYLADLIGCILTFEGNSLATIMGWYEGAQYPLLEVQKENGQKNLIPFHRYYLGKIDLEKRSVELLTPWILE